MNAHNIMEEIVKNYLDDIMRKKTDMCKCDKCVDAIMALTLSNIPAKYIITDSGAMYTLMEQVKVEKAAVVLKELVKVIEFINKNPAH